VQRTFSAAQTPFERLTALAGIADEPRQQLAQQWTATNPRQLRRQFEALDALCTAQCFPGAVGGCLSDAILAPYP